MKIVYGKVLKGGSPERRERLIDLAINDLQSKIGHGSITALDTYDDDSAFYVIAAVQNGIEPTDKKADQSKKGGK